MLLKPKKNFSLKLFLRLTLATILILAIALFAIPPLLLYFSKPEVSSQTYPYETSFRTDYDDIRENLALHASNLKASGREVIFSNYPIDASDNLYIDSIFVEPTKTQENLVILTTGVHGIEGYIGATMLDVFIDTILPTLDQENTGVLIVANVNPYGMKYKRRYNENNVDLNRNFISDWDTFNLDINKDYPIVSDFLEPQSPIANMLLHELGFLGGLARQVTTNGISTLSNALLGGQYQSATGVYYGGTQDEKSTQYLKNIFKETLHSDYQNIIHLDLHSGYGPRYGMTIFNSSYEKMTEQESIQAFNYEPVIAFDSPNFYPTTGDTTEYFYRLAEAEGSAAKLYSTCFEFGTLGDDFLNSIKSMKYTIDENRNHYFPSDSRLTTEILHQRYMEMFYPSEAQWRTTAIENFIQATEGVLSYKLQ